MLLQESRAEVLGQIGKNCSARCTVKKDHLVEKGGSLKPELIDFTRPIIRRIVRESGLEGEVVALFDRRLRAPDFGCRVGRLPVLQKQVMDLVRADKVGYTSDLVDLSAQVGVQTDRRPDPDRPLASWITIIRVG